MCVADGMKNRLSALLVAFVATVISCHDAHAQFSRLSFGKYGVESLWPESMSFLAGSVWAEVTNSDDGLRSLTCHRQERCETFSFFVKRATLSIFAILLLVVYAKYFIQRT